MSCHPILFFKPGGLTKMKSLTNEFRPNNTAHHLLNLVFFFLFQPTPQHQMRSRRSAYAPADDDDGILQNHVQSSPIFAHLLSSTSTNFILFAAEDGSNHASPEHENCESQGGDDKNSAPKDQTCNGGDDKNSAPGVQTCNA
jgi:hypothetical protein